MKKTVIGLEKFILNEAKHYRTARIGLLANQASVASSYTHALDLIDAALPGALKVLFGPQHGWVGEKQDNMIESGHSVDKLGRPIFSLYGDVRSPTTDMLSHLDVLLIDLFDVGTRVYTFAQTISHCLKAASNAKVSVVVLDRPNPIGGLEVEGNVLADDCVSFVGLNPIPMRHGLTMGEMALFINNRLEKPAALKVISCENWHRHQYFPETKLPWVLPSPNMPTFDCAHVYPGQVLWEGTNISEGRGTTRPFNLMGAPFIKAELLWRKLKALDLPGVIFRKAHFEPTFHKWAGEVCEGVEIFPLDQTFKPYLTSLCILKEILNLWPDDFKLKSPPYEYEFVRRPIDLILGDSTVFNRLQHGESPFEAEKLWHPKLLEFLKQRDKVLLY
ncbi:MAG: exo-beta-N-acetylmuramidase NamZ family protein [Candidatus Adiutrix sp.]